MIAFPLGRHCRPALMLMAMSTLTAASAHAAADTLATVQKSATEWVRLRAETARLETEWTNDQVLLSSLVTGLEEKAATLEEQRDHVKAKTAQDREELDGLRAKQTAAAADLATTEQRAKDLTAALLALRPQLPPRLSEALELPYRSLAGATPTVGERMQLVTAVLNRCVQFNRTITCGEDVLALEAGAGARSVQVIYWGLSHGYALDRAAGKAWLGTPGPQGWTWEPRPDAVAAVGELIAIYQDHADPGFVAVPARLAHPAAAAAQP